MDIKLAEDFELPDDVVLRALSESDTEQVYSTVVRNRDRLKRYMHWMTDEYSIAEARQYIKEASAARLEFNSAGYGFFRDISFLGAIGFVYFDWKVRKTEIGYWIDGGEEGKGIVSAACMSLIDHAFADLGLNRIEIRCAVENKRSAAIPERLGFTREGVLRQSEIRDGRLQDFSIYGMLADEWRRRA